MQEELIEHYSINARIDRSLNSFFVGNVENEEGYKRIDVDDYWTEDGLRCPAEYTEVEIYTRKVYSYPLVVFRTPLFSMPLDTGVQIFLGLVAGDTLQTPSACLHQDGGITNFHVYVEGTASMTVTSLLPANYDTGYNRYAIKLNKCNAELFINGVLRAVALFGLPNGIPSWQDTEPYCLRGSVNAPIHSALPALINLKTSIGQEATFPMPSNRQVFAYLPGDPLPPRQFPVYNENSSTKWSNLATGGNTITSHPIPVWGYPNKTLYFMADAAGALDIEVYVGGGWRVYDSPTLTANKLLVYSFPAEMQAPVMRLVYDPTDADTIVLAEVDMA
ncbi:MAG: hypothetical protein ACTSSA_11515 [Candidatus Freyarchaeota archaeon]